MMQEQWHMIGRSGEGKNSNERNERKVKKSERIGEERRRVEGMKRRQTIRKDK